MLSPCGPWRPVRLEIYESRISELKVDYDFSDSLDEVHGTVAASVEGQKGSRISFTIRIGDQTVIAADAVVDEHRSAQLDFSIPNVELWYPHGYGKQPLYEVEAALHEGDVSIHSTSRRTAFRKAELVQQPDDVGKSFFFRINGVDVFCGGSNWIPADSFTPRISEERYRKWLSMMVRGYQTMIRCVTGRSMHCIGSDIV